MWEKNVSHDLTPRPKTTRPAAGARGPEIAMWGIAQTEGADDAAGRLPCFFSDLAEARQDRGAC